MTSEIKRVVVMGAGGVGWWLVTALCREPMGREIVVYDDDTFEGGQGAKRLPWQTDPGQFKVDALRRYVRLVMGDAPPVVYAGRLTSDLVQSVEAFPKDYWATSLVVDCTDMDLSRRIDIWKALKGYETQMLRVSYDGNGVIVIARGLPLSSRPGGGYALVPSMAQAMAAGGFGAMAVHKILKGEPVGDQEIQIKEGF